MTIDRSNPALRVSLMPKDTNALGTIFGGLILSYIDQAGAVEAHRRIRGRLVTVAIHEVEFHEPVFVGDLVSFYARVEHIGTTSIRVKVVVEAERGRAAGHKVTVTEAEVVYVHVDDENRPLAIELASTARRKSSGGPAADPPLAPS